MYRKYGKIILPLVLASLISSCQQKSLSPVSSDQPSIDNIEQSKTGVKLENPYTVETMMRARDSLEKQGVLSKKLPDAWFQPTHFYIRFKPQTKEEYLELKKDSNLTLWDYPLDYKFPEGMADYRDSEIPAGRPNYLYTALKVNQKMPSKNYEILAKLILASEPEDKSLSKSTDLSGYYDILEGEALRITGNSTDSKKALSKRMSWVPSGNIQVWDNVLNRNMPVVSVNVRTRNWFKWWDGYTDINGNFRCAKDYIGDIEYSLRWQYPDCRFDIRSGLTGQAFYNGPNQSSSAWNLVISSGLSWMYASIFKAGSYYLLQEPFGLRDKPFDLISIQALDESEGAERSRYNGANENIKIHRNKNSGTQRNSQELFYVTSHELAHAHHDEIYDGNFLANVNLTVIESWACAAGYYLTSSIYYLPVNTSLNYYTRQEWSIGDDAYAPLMIDLIDTYNQRADDQNDLQDFISGYTLKQMETIIAKGGCKTVNDFANEIKALPLPRAITNTILNDYFNQYSGIVSPRYNSTVAYGGFNFTQGTYYYTPNGRFFLIWQGDGNLVLYDTYQSPWRDVWTSNTWGRTTTQCIMQGDGNLVIYDHAHPNPAVSNNVWCTNTWGNSNARLSIEDNGRVVIYNSSVTQELWSSTSDNSIRF